MPGRHSANNAGAAVGLESPHRSRGTKVALPRGVAMTRSGRLHQGRHRLPAPDQEAPMAFARVVTFEGVNAERMAAMQAEMEGGERPPDVPATEIVVLHDPEAERSLVIVFFDTEED